MACKAEIGDFDVETVIEQNVFRFQVSVSDVAWVDVVYALKDLAHDVASLFLRQRDDRRQIVEEFTVTTELEYQEDESIGLENVLKFD